MKKLIIIALVFIGISSIYGQTKKKVVVNNNSAKSQTTKTVKTITINNQVAPVGTKTFSGPFTISGSNGTANYEYLEDSTGNRVFNGKFTYSGKIGEKLTETISGNYKNDLKDGYWIYNTKTIPGLRTISDKKFSGLYKNGYPDGLWTLNYLTKFTDGTINSGKSLTGTTITITGTANYKNKHLCGAFNFENKQTGDNIKPLSVKGSFDENGLMDGKWIVKFARRMNDPISELTIDYKNGIIYHFRELNTQTGEAENKDLSASIKILPLTYDTLTNLFISTDNSIYQGASKEDKDSEYGRQLRVASDFFCKADGEDHYHKNTKGCIGCSYFKAIDTNKILYNSLALDAENNGELKKAAKIYKLLILGAPEYQSLNYRNLSWTNCKLGNFIENIESCREGLKVATRDDKDIIIKNLAHSYLFTNKYDEAKKYYLEYANNDLDKLKQRLESDFDIMNQAGIKNINCDKIKNEVNSMIENKK